MPNLLPAGPTVAVNAAVVVEAVVRGRKATMALSTPKTIGTAVTISGTGFRGLCSGGSAGFAVLTLRKYQKEKSTS